MIKLIRFLVLPLLLFALFNTSPAYVRLQRNIAGDGPYLSTLDMEEHDVSAVFLAVSNQGVIGNDIPTGNGTGFFPSGTGQNYVFGTGLWFGAQYDADDDGDMDKVFTQGYNPLAGDSEFREGRNDQSPDDPLTRVFDSLNREVQGDGQDLEEWPPQFRDPETGDPIVYSDQDLVTTYTTHDRSPIFGSFQLPLDVHQRSMAFRNGLVAQVIFFIFEVEHIGEDVLTDTWIGFDSDMDIGREFEDDLSSFALDRVEPGGDTATVDMGFAWDSDFVEPNFTVTDPGFVGIALLVGPGNPNDGIDNDGDGIVDESPYNGIDDDGDMFVDEWDEIDEIGLVNYTKHCNPSVPCGVLDPQTDEDGYDMLSCDTPGSRISCLESATPADVRFMLSSGPFDWQPGETQMIAFAMVFANATGDRDLPFVGDPPRPDPNDDDLVELMQAAEQARELFSTIFPTVGIGDDPGGVCVELPRGYTLFQNFPNPFNPSTTIAFDIPMSNGTAQSVSLAVYDLRGRCIRKLVDSELQPGTHKIHWDGRNDRGQSMASGIYLYRLKAGDEMFTRKMTVLK
jgi:hypothetical protein